MGLDMYLYRVRPGETSETIDTYLNGPIEGEKEGQFDIEAWRKHKAKVEVAYWRKANAIHGWFVNAVQGGVDECQYSEPFGREVLAGLAERCKRVLAGQSAPEDALPAMEGFFFGSAEYDEWYERDLKETIEMLEPLLQERNGDTFVYHSSW